MFVAADGLVETARAGPWAADTESLDAVARFAADWRHGLTGSPVMMPGFFAVGLAVGWWHSGRGLLRLAAEGVAAALLALAAASAVGPAQTRLLVHTFAVEKGLGLEDPVAPFTSTAAAIGLLTVSCWTALVAALPRVPAVGWARALAIPCVLYAGLFFVRPWKSGAAATAQWAERASRGDAPALCSLALGGLAVWLVARHAVDQGSRATGRSAFRE